MDELKWRGVTRGFPVLFIVRLQLLPRVATRFASDCCEPRVQPQQKHLAKTKLEKSSISRAPT